ncbi:MAG: VOC family protein [Chloroflexi bacterium]|nr:VOC family protein [Chloroflexota bacterium]
MLGAIKTVGVYVEDQAKAIDFYVEVLGFEVRRRMQMGADAEWVEVAPPGAETCLVIYPRALMPDWAERKSSLVFYCPDVRDTVETLGERGVTIAMEPGDLPWGTFAAIEDPDGNWLGLTDQEIAYAS